MIGDVKEAQEWIDKKPNTLKAVLRGIRKATELLANDRPKALEAMQKQLRIDPDALKVMADANKYADKHPNKYTDQYACSDQHADEYTAANQYTNEYTDQHASANEHANQYPDQYADTADGYANEYACTAERDASTNQHACSAEPYCDCALLTEPR